MRVVYLSASGHLGGAERCLLDLVAGIRQTRPDWSLRVVSGEAGPLTTRLSALGVSTTVLPFPTALARLGESGASILALGARLAASGLSATSYLRQLKRTLDDLAPDVVHSNGPKMHALAARAKPARAHLVWHLHDFIGRRPLTRRLLRLNRRGCAAIIANSAAVAADARRALGTEAGIYPVPNGVDLGTFSPDGHALDLDRLAGLAPLPLPGVRVGLVATMARWKGHEVFLKAVARVPAGGHLRAYVIGGPIYQTDASQYTLDELRRRASQLGVAARVGFTGFVAEPAAAMRALDIVVHASTAPEPFGLVVAEAMACERAVVMSADSGVADYVTPGRDVMVVAPGDEAALAARIEQLATDEDLRRRLGKSALVTAERHFDRSRVAEQITALYDSITERRA